MIWEIIGDGVNEMDVMISLDGKMVGMHDTVKDVGIGHDCTLRCTGGSGVVLRGSGSNSLTFWDSGRARRVDKNWCGRSEIVASGVGARRAMIRLHLQLLLHCGSHRRPQRSNPVNPTYRPNQRPSQPVAPTASVQHFPPLTQPLPVGLVTPGTVTPSFPAGSLDWLKASCSRS